MMKKYLIKGIPDFIDNLAHHDDHIRHFAVESQVFKHVRGSAEYRNHRAGLNHVLLPLCHA